MAHQITFLSAFSYRMIHLLRQVMSFLDHSNEFKPKQYNPFYGFGIFIHKETASLFVIVLCLSLKPVTQTIGLICQSALIHHLFVNTSLNA